jgi:dihydrofolate reductase
MQNDLIDEDRLLVYPVVLGSGKRLFGDANRAALRSVETRTFSSGVILLRYQPVRK